jgi:hypothetical protein
MLWTLGGVTPKKRCMSASAGGWPFTSVYIEMNARYWPWISVNGGDEVAMLLPI